MEQIQKQLASTEPHRKVEFDLAYFGGNYAGVGQFALIPDSAVAQHGSIEKAFTAITGHAPQHIINAYDEERFTADGDEWEASGKVAPSTARYVFGDWTHIFGVGQANERNCRIVFDRQDGKLIRLEIGHGIKGWVVASEAERADVEDSIKNANEDAIDSPEDWGLEASDHLPEWAIDPHQRADDVLAAYEFGPDVTVVEQDNWNTDDPADWTKVVYVAYGDDAPDADSHKVSFHVRFKPDGTIDDAYALEMERGNDIGQRGDKWSGTQEQAQDPDCVEADHDALVASGVTDYCNQVCGGGNCGSGRLCQYGVDSKTHMPPRKSPLLEIRKVLVLATSHLTEQTCLEYKAWPFIAGFEDGCYFYVGDEPELYTDAPEDLQTVLAFAKQHGCTEVKFDRDAHELTQLPVYEG